MNDNPKWRFSRSHSEDYKRCHRYYWLRYHEKGTGLESVRLSIGLAKGGCVHAIMQTILMHLKMQGTLPDAHTIRVYIHAHVDAFKQEARARQFEGVESEFNDIEVDRQAALVEGMVRAWCRVRLPFIHQTYEVVEVEKENEVALDEEGEIVLMDRPDAELRHRESGRYAAMELKTTSTDRVEYFDSWRYATQTMGHVLAMEAKYGERSVDHVLMEFMYGGFHKTDKLSGMVIYYSPLLRGYVMPAQPPLLPKEQYLWNYTSKKGWSAFNVHEWNFPDKPAWMTNVEYWVEHVLDYAVVKDQLFTREIFRSQEEMDRWKMQVLSQQRRIYTGVQSMQEPQLVETVMHWCFPGNFDESCYQGKYFKQCPFLAVCYGQVAGDPIESGLFRQREPHHVQEFEV